MRQFNSRDNTSVVQKNRMDLVVLILVFLRAAVHALFGCDWPRQAGLEQPVQLRALRDLGQMPGARVV